MNPSPGEAPVGPSSAPSGRRRDAYGSVAGDGEGRADLVREWREEANRVVSSRVAPVLLTYVAGLLLADVVEARLHPDRTNLLWLSWLLEVAVVAGALALRSRASRHRRSAWLAALTCACVAIVVTAYNGAVGASLERLVVAQVSLLLAFAMVFAAGGRGPQVLLATGVMGSGIGAVPFLEAADGVFFPLAGLSVGAATAVAVASVVHLNMRNAFLGRQLLLEEIEVSHALLRSGASLNRHVAGTQLFAEIDTIAVETLAADWASILQLEGGRLVVRHALGIGIDAACRIGGAAVDRLVGGPMLAESMADDQGEDGVAPRWLAAPIRLDQELRGVIVVGWHEPPAQASRRERELAAGLADATSLAVRNAALIAEARSAAEVKSEFVATVSHELRTPLNVMLGYLEMLDDGALGALNPGQIETVGRVGRSARELAGLVDATLDLTRLDAGREVVNPVRLHLPHLLDTVLDETRERFRPDVRAHVQCAQEAWTVVVDPAKLRLVLRNLLSNAVRFTEAGEVRIEAAAEAGDLVIRVGDTGCGIPVADVPYVFDRFRQARGARLAGGVGLGLHIVHRLVELMGGSIDVSSREGEGSTFTCRLPGAIASVEVLPARVEELAGPGQPAVDR